MTAAGRVRILHVVEDGDTSGFFSQVARFRDPSRYHVLFATLRPTSRDFRAALEREHVEALSVGARSRAEYPVALARLVRMLRRLRIDILHTHLFDPSVVGLAAGVLARVPVRVMTRHHSDYHTRIAKRWHVRLDQLCTRLSHRVIAISEHTRRVMLDEERAPDDKIVVIPNGIDLARVAPPAPEDLAAVRAELAADDALVVSVVARLHPEKGQEHLFRAMPRVIDATAGRVVLLVAGTGSFRAQYEAEVRRLGVERHVRFLGFRHDVARIFAISDVVVLPSVAEGFGLVLAEAMALQRPIVATRVGGIPEVVEDGVTGLLVPPARPDALADAIVGLLKDPGRRVSLGHAGRRRVEVDFRFDVMMRRYEAVYETMLETEAVGSPR